MISAVLTCVLDEQTYSIVMDTVASDTVRSTITVTSQPLVTGDFIADHMFKEPISYSIRGVFGMGKRQGIVVNDGNLLLTEIQTLFERIKNEGIVCSIVRVKIDDQNNREMRFLQRDNLVLKSITWTENIDTLGFSFDFEEIAFARTIEYDVDTSDAFYPNVKELQQRSFSETLLSREDALKSILAYMYETGIMSDSFWQAMLGTRSETFMGLGISVVVAVAIAKLVVACGATGPQGLLVGAIIVVVALIGIAISKIVRYCQYKIKPFDDYNDRELKRWSELMEKLSNEIDEMANHIQVYQPTDEGDQECILTVNDKVLVFKFTRNNTEGYPTLVVEDGNTDKVGGWSNMTSAPRSYGDCSTKTISDTVYTDATNETYIHLLYTGDDTQEAKMNMKNYLLTISNIKPEKFNEMIGTIVKNYLLR